MLCGKLQHILGKLNLLCEFQSIELISNNQIKLLEYTAQ